MSSLYEAGRKAVTCGSLYGYCMKIEPPNSMATAPAAAQSASTRTLPERVRSFLATLGPGLITGAADDDPSGISPYSVTGAAFGYLPLWTALFSLRLPANSETPPATANTVPERSNPLRFSARRRCQHTG